MNTPNTTIVRRNRPRRRERTMPPDPDEMNVKRALWVERAIEQFRKDTRTDLEDALADLLADMGHYCDRTGESLQKCIERAKYHYDAETEGNGKQWS